MSSLAASDPRTDTDTWATLALAIAAGVALGVLDLLLIEALPYPLANLANSSAVWALAAFAFARLTQGGAALSATAGAVLLVVAVESYYLAAVALDLADTGRLLAATTIAWVVFGLVAGAGFGAAGAWARDRSPDSWWAPIGIALATAVLLAEALLRIDAKATAALTVMIALGVLASEAGRPGVIARAVVVTAPLTILCFTAFALAGFRSW